VSRFVIKPATEAADIEGASRLEDTGLYVADVPDPKALVERSGDIAWAAPAEDDAGQESYPTGEVSIRFTEPVPGDALKSFVEKHGLELLRHNEYVPEQVVVAPTDPRGTWLPDVVDRLNAEGVVRKAWPNTMSRYKRI
jgi:hypothetical protein